MDQLSKARGRPRRNPTSDAASTEITKITSPLEKKQTRSRLAPENPSLVHGSGVKKPDSPVKERHVRNAARNASMIIKDFASNQRRSSLDGLEAEDQIVVATPTLKDPVVPPNDRGNDIKADQIGSSVASTYRGTTLIVSGLPEDLSKSLEEHVSRHETAKVTRANRPFSFQSSPTPDSDQSIALVPNGDELPSDLSPSTAVSPSAKKRKRNGYKSHRAKGGKARDKKQRDDLDERNTQKVEGQEGEPLETSDGSKHHLDHLHNPSAAKRSHSSASDQLPSAKRVKTESLAEDGIEILPVPIARKPSVVLSEPLTGSIPKRTQSLPDELNAEHQEDHPSITKSLSKPADLSVSNLQRLNEEMNSGSSELSTGVRKAISHSGLAFPGWDNGDKDVESHEQPIIGNSVALLDPFMVDKGSASQAADMAKSKATQGSATRVLDGSTVAKLETPSLTSHIRRDVSRQEFPSAASGEEGTLVETEDDRSASPLSSPPGSRDGFHVVKTVDRSRVHRNRQTSTAGRCPLCFESLSDLTVPEFRLHVERCLEETDPTSRSLKNLSTSALHKASDVDPDGSAYLESGVGHVRHPEPRRNLAEDDLTDFPPAYDGTITDVNDPEDGKLLTQYEGITDPAKFMDALENPEDMTTDRLYQVVENVAFVLEYWQDEWISLEDQVCDITRQKRRDPRGPIDPVTFEDQKEASLYGYRWDPHPAKRGQQDPFTQKGGLLVAGKELRRRGQPSHGWGVESDDAGAQEVGGRGRPRRTRGLGPGASEAAGSGLDTSRATPLRNASRLGADGETPHASDVPRKRGRPRVNKLPPRIRDLRQAPSGASTESETTPAPKVPKRRGRPPKNPLAGAKPVKRKAEDDDSDMEKKRTKSAKRSAAMQLWWNKRKKMDRSDKSKLAGNEDANREATADLADPQMSQTTGETTSIPPEAVSTAPPRKRKGRPPGTKGKPAMGIKSERLVDSAADESDLPAEGVVKPDLTEYETFQKLSQAEGQEGLGTRQRRPRKEISASTGTTLAEVDEVDGAGANVTEAEAPGESLGDDEQDAGTEDEDEPEEDEDDAEEDLEGDDGESWDGY